ncbi:MAG: MotA/TolQ/ExbB proton channel family protein [Candidatus Polarisedimenticolaceae bacterium]|nr:MotA/TolQ/ExbB proton channel family protein [Candidatus Polarisedimenticolaceae bacterium]
MEHYQTLIRFFQEGGLFMYPIMLVFAVGIAIALERYIYLTVARSGNRKAWQKVLPHLNEGKFERALKTAENTKSSIGNILTYGLSRAHSSRRREDVEMAMEEGLMEVVPRLEKRTPYLSTLANICTLLGLLGTIVGLIQAFTAVAQADPSEKADLLSASISVAMNTTAFGLMCAIPLLIIYALLQSRTTEIVDSLEMASVKFLNIFSDMHHQIEKREID